MAVREEHLIREVRWETIINQGAYQQLVYQKTTKNQEGAKRLELLLWE